MKNTVSKTVVAKKSKSLSPVRVDNAVFVRTVTHYYTGRIVEVSANQIVLTDAAWIADTGRFSTALASGTLNEIEPYPDGANVSVNVGAIVDVSDWKHSLPRTVK